MAFDPTEVTALENKVLEDIQLSVATRLAGVDHLRIRPYIDYIVDGMVLQMQGYIHSLEIGKEVVEFPKDWWEAFKERWFPQWYLRRHPVKKEVHEFRAMEWADKISLPDDYSTHRVVLLPRIFVTP